MGDEQNITVLFEDDWVVVVDKPSGVLSVPGRTETDCVLSRMQRRVSDLRTVHRLDRDTSGLLLFARTAKAQRELSRQFELRQIDKEYQAIVSGAGIENQTIELPVRKAQSISLPPTYVVDPIEGRPATTVLRVLAEDGQTSRLSLFPLTGRSHQLRVHCQAIGHPIVGDPIYGKTSGSRLMLHARILSFWHPETKDRVTVTSRVPF